jgi:serpin B
MRSYLRAIMQTRDPDDWTPPGLALRVKDMPLLRPGSRSTGNSPRRRSSALLGSSLLSVLLASASCSSDGETGAGAGRSLQELRGSTARVSATSALPNPSANDGWAFAWQLYAEEAAPDQNVFFSPYSISTAFAMLVGGAAGSTKTEIEQVLDFSSDGEAFDAAQNDVLQALDARNRAGTESTPAQALRVSNGIWLVPGFQPQKSFLDRLSAYYGVSAFRAPFDTDPEGARQAINARIAKDTEQLIPELLPSHSVDAAVFVLTNALYFKSHWATPFASAGTKDGPFHAENGTTTTVPLMHANLAASYSANSQYQTRVLPSAQDELELVAIMPAAGSFDTFVSELDADTVAAATAQLARTQMNLTFPKFKLEHEVDLTSRLQALGMQTAFSDGADFSGIAPGIALSGAFHQATISVDEDGTEAAAATAIVAVETSAPLNPIAVSFDQPFVFFIRDVQTHAVLFVGQLANP